MGAPSPGRVGPFGRAVIAGVLAGCGFAAWTVGSYGVGGRGTWRPLNLVAHVVWRDAPTSGGFSLMGAVVGLLILLAAGIVLIAPYAALASGAGLSAPVTLVGAAVYTNAAWVIGDYLVWPKLDPVAARDFSPGVAWLGHIVGGIAAGAALAAQPGLGSAARRRWASITGAAGRLPGG
ncbi:hypothetical protein [Rugosimonospora africana]|uniref:Uncharacterized protein n=1 Tax=Rugosimonospora africana TaxID=556532 RepID=A0A8J3QN65_9ACTN|nr:hypothetical protein [Rugosimonospora africana]GIH14009.1 hypothetical protein Raf01_21810 [Rugosimonospora africana]